MMSIRSHDQFNTTIYGQNDRYRGIFGGRRVVFMNAADIADRGLRAGQWVDLTSHFEGEQRQARQFNVVPYDIPAGCAATYYPEANPLVPLRHVADGSNQPASKSVVITVARAATRPNREKRPARFLRTNRQTRRFPPTEPHQLSATAEPRGPKKPFPACRSGESSFVARVERGYGTPLRSRNRKEIRT